MLRNSDHILETIHYLEKVEFIVYVKDQEQDAFKDWLIDLTNDQAQIKATGNKYVEIDITATDMN